MRDLGASEVTHQGGAEAADGAAGPPSEKETAVGPSAPHAQIAAPSKLKAIAALRAPAIAVVRQTKITAGLT